MTLTEFLLARIAEDETNDTTLCGVARKDWSARWLAECQAKRAITANCDPDFGYGRLILLILAAVYADHPDFDPAWRISP